MDQITVKRCLSTNMNGCWTNPKHPCCQKYLIDRFFPIGPYVQPTLTENWISALFQLTGSDPLAFFAIKSLLTITAVVILTSLWGLLGIYVGFIPTSKGFRKLQRKNDIDIENEWIVDIANNENLMEKLDAFVSENDAMKGINDFLCCLSKSKGFRCTVKNKDRGNLQCVTQLMYDIKLNNER